MQQSVDEKQPMVMEIAESPVDYSWPHCAPLKNDEVNSFVFSGAHYRKEFLGDHWEFVIDVIKPDFKELFNDLRDRVFTDEEYLVVHQIYLEFQSAIAAQDVLRINATLRPQRDTTSEG